jgi:hypothetical protein
MARAARFSPCPGVLGMRAPTNPASTPAPPPRPTTLANHGKMPQAAAEMAMFTSYPTYPPRRVSPESLQEKPKMAGGMGGRWAVGPVGST